MIGFDEVSNVNISETAYVMCESIKNLKANKTHVWLLPHAKTKVIDSRYDVVVYAPDAEAMTVLYDGMKTAEDFSTNGGKIEFKNSHIGGDLINGGGQIYCDNLIVDGDVISFGKDSRVKSKTGVPIKVGGTMTQSVTDE